MLEIEALHLVSTCSITELHPQPLMGYIFDLKKVKGLISDYSQQI
jgi:hypothetical protein